MLLIALRTVRYNDRHSILSVYSAERGRLSVLVPAGGGREARRTRALLMPLSVVEAEVAFRPDRSIFAISDVRTAPRLTPLHISGDPLRGLLGLFLADVLESLVRESPPDPLLFDGVRDIAARLAEAPSRSLPNFHLLALVRLARLTGIEPDTATYRPGRFLDLTEGVWRNTPPVSGQWLEAAPSRVAALLASLQWHHASLLRLDTAARRTAIDTIVSYFEAHLGTLRLPSLSILREL